MGFTFRKKIAPGINLSIGPKGPTLSGRVGVRGAGVSVNTRGRMTASAGVGGLRYQKSASLHSKAKAPTTAPSAPAPAERQTRTIPAADAAFIASAVAAAGEENVMESYAFDPDAAVEEFLDQYLPAWIDAEEGSMPSPDVAVLAYTHFARHGGTAAYLD